jgi:hypothetical protein
VRREKLNYELPCAIETMAPGEVPEVSQYVSLMPGKMSVFHIRRTVSLPSRHRHPMPLHEPPCRTRRHGSLEGEAERKGLALPFDRILLPVISRRGTTSSFCRGDDGGHPDPRPAWSERPTVRRQRFRRPGRRQEDHSPADSLHPAIPARDRLSQNVVSRRRLPLMKNSSGSKLWV